MMPKVIIHNSVSLDGSLTDFEPNMELHYQIAGNYKPDAHLIGSNTVKVGTELYGEGVPPEEAKDFEKPKRAESLPVWVIPDTEGALKGLLHTCRRFEFCKDVVVLVSEQTPKEYIEHLKERNYGYHVVGKKHVDLEKALELLSAKYGVKKVLADTGRVLGNLLLNQGLASEVSLLIHPVIVGSKSYSIFSNVSEDISLKLDKAEILDKGYVWLVYTVRK
ncbi:dihydrofolate reductase family protein [Candidatus Bathyarchaeota archaeon]|nr:dihydrofolate reductase family protein [Candidatus Bathyarchaeota archaeon]